MPEIKKLQFSSGVAVTAPTDITAATSGELTVAKSADYTILDDDGYTTILVTTSGTNRTMTLPTVADNDYRVIKIKKVDSGTGTVIVDGEGAETIDGATTFVLERQYEEVTVQSDGAAWHVLSTYSLPASSVRVDTGNGHGSTSTAVRRFTNTVTVGTAITAATSSTAGTTFTINEAGIYAMTYTDAGTGGAGAFGIGLNATGTTSVLSLAPANRLATFVWATANTYGCVSATIKLAVNDVITPHTNTNPNATDDYIQFTIAQVAKL